MPTFNSEKTIKIALDSIANQTIDTSNLECLVIDGGSTDNTLNIASQFKFVKILNNPEKIPEIAKKIGIKNAKGKYIIFMDSDEEFLENSSLNMRLKYLAEYKNAHIVICDQLISPVNYKKEYGIASNYINICGDPFSFFMYRFRLLKYKMYKKSETKEFLFDFSNSISKPIADGGTTTVDADFCRKNNLFNKNEGILADKIFSISPFCICVKGDNVRHYSKGMFIGYLKKIKYRIINNLFDKKVSGFSNRETKKSYKKFLFPLYVCLLFPVLADSIYLSVKYNDITFLLHIVYSFYTIFCILYFLILKLFKVRIKTKAY